MDIFNLTAWLAKVLLYLATTAVIGGAFVRQLIRQDVTVLAWLRYYSMVAALLGIASVGLTVALQLLLFSGQGFASFYDWEVYSILLAGNMGLSWGLALSGFVSCALVALFYWQSKYMLIGILAGNLAILLSFVFTGHIVHTAWYGKLALVVHLFAVSCWIGALLPLWRITYLRNHVLIARVMTKFGQAALVFVGLLLLMGVLLLQILLGDLQLLWQTTYGQTLLVKLSLVALLLGLGATNKLLLVPKLAEPCTVKHLRTTISIEMIAAVLVLAVTAWATVIIGLNMS